MDTNSSEKIEVIVNKSWVYSNDPRVVIIHDTENMLCTRRFSETCPWPAAIQFKGIECGYKGSETVCDGSYPRCHELENGERFGGELGFERKVKNES